MNEARKDPIYVFGHRNPDTDSVVSSMAYAALCNAMGEETCVPARLGHLNDETAFLLDKFGFEAPLYLHTVRTQVRDIAFDRPPCLNAAVAVRRAWDVLAQDPNLSSVPVTDEAGCLYGMVTAGSIAESDMESLQHPVLKDVPVFNVLAALEGRIMNDEEDMFDNLSGEVMIALPGGEEGLQGVKPQSVIICGHQEDVVQQALETGVRCIILCQTSLADKYRGMSSRTCIIATPHDAYRAARMLFQAIPVGRIAQHKNLVKFHMDDFLDDVRETVLESRYRSYPVLDEHEKVVGTLGRFHLIRPSRKRVVLMDHNEVSQSVPGLEQAEIVGIIDHHRLADVQTGNPVFMRNEPVGSTTTIVATMFQERGLLPSAKLAGLMAAAILSDTVLFKSPTCTNHDRRMAERLARMADIDLDELGKEIFSVGQSGDKPVDELLRTDFKEFHIAGHSLGIAQVSTLDTERMLTRLPEILAAMEEKKDKNGYDFFLLMLTDVLRVGTELVFLGNAEDVRAAFNTAEIKGQHVFLPGVISRKKQVVPALSILWG